MKFSDRIGVTTPRAALQVGEMDAALRNSLWNWLANAVARRVSSADDSPYWERALGDIFVNFFKYPIDNMPTPDSRSRAWLLEWFLSSPWSDAYNLVEFVLPRIQLYRGRSGDHTQGLNAVLEREKAGYRVIAGTLTPITNPTELESVAAAATTRSGYEGVATHITAAAEFLGKKPEPDYRNSIKESISAVEAAAKLLAGGKSGGIDDALKILEKRGDLHPALKSALSKLYGWTSDDDGIRHALLDPSTTTFAQAKFMLVACSAFVNLLLGAA